MGPMGMGAMGMQPIRQGTSHIVPVVVAAGLAVGVFCGLLFGLGTRHEVVAPSRGGTGAKQSEESQIQTAQVSTGTKLPDRTRPASGAAGSAVGSAVAAGGSNTGGAAAGTGSAAAPGPGKLKVEIEPASAAQAAKVLVDGQPITGAEVEIPFDPGVSKKSVKVVVRVPGNKEIEKSIEVESDGTASISFDLKGVKFVAVPDDGSKAAGGNAGGTPSAGGGATGGASNGGNTGGGNTGGGNTGGGNTGGGNTGGGSKNTGGGGTGGGSKNTGGKGSGKGSGKSGLIDI